MSNKTKEIPSGLIQKKLCQLYPEIGNVFVVAMIISKSEPNIFLSKNDTQYKGVMNFTLRDAKEHLVNCKVWDSRENVEEYNQLLKIGDIVDVIGPRVTAINLKADAADSKQPRYQPVSSLPFALVLNEGYGCLQKHSYSDLERYAEIKQLRHQSHKPLYSVMNLADVKNSLSGAKSQTFHTDFLVIVGLLRSPRQIRSTKDGKAARHCLEVVVFDQSLSSGMIMTLWHEEWIQRAQQFWQPMKTVLHLIDVKVQYSEFYRGCILSYASRSLIYENPIGQETKNLQEYANSIPKTPFQMFGHQSNTDSLPKPDEIHAIMTVRQIYTRSEGQLTDNSEQFTAVLYAMITQFDLDNKARVISKRCKACSRLIYKTNNICENEQCQLAFSFNDASDKFVYFFNMNVFLSDQTGTLVEGRLSDETATRILGLTCNEYLERSESEVEKLKYSFLLNHFKVKLLIRKPTMLRNKLTVLIIDMTSVDLDELAKNIVVY